MWEAIIAAVLVALTSIIGALFFGAHKGLVGKERYVIPVAVGVFLSLVLFELIPETLASSPEWGGIVVAGGFIAFYIIAQLLHKRYHAKGIADCDRRSAATLLLVGDTFHNISDGIILGGAFLIDPAIGMATALGLALHEIPQEIVEFGILVRAGYSRIEAILRNVLSAGGIVVGTIIVMLISEHSADWLWVLTGLAAGNLLFLAASDLLPRIHGSLERYGSIWYASAAIVAGFVLMTGILEWTHAYMEHGHDHGHAADELLHDEHEEHEEHDVHDDHDAEV